MSAAPDQVWITNFEKKNTQQDEEETCQDAGMFWGLSAGQQGYIQLLELSLWMCFLRQCVGSPSQQRHTAYLRPSSVRQW